MPKGPSAPGTRARSNRSERDAGVSLIEILIAIVLLATVGTAVMTSLRMSVIGSATEREHARAHQWLQSATEVLVNEIPWADCNPASSATSAITLQATYETELQSKTLIKPYQWQQFQIQVSKPVEFAGPAGAYGATCYETEDRQRITVEVRSPTYDIIETVEVVKIP